MEICKTLHLKKFLFILLLFYNIHSLYATEYFVSITGNDNNPGTIFLPWKTIAKANQTVEAGDIIYLREGRYNEAIIPSRSGIDGSPIVYSSYANEVAVIHSLNEGAQLNGLDYIIINRIHFEDCYYFVRSEPSGFRHCIIKDCRMENQKGWCGIEIGDGSRYNKILNNYIDSGNIEGDCIHIGMDAVGEKYGAQYNLVAGNECTGAKHGGICCAGDKTKFNIIRDNYIHEIGDNNIATGALTSFVLIEGNQIHNPGADSDDAAGIQLRSENSIIRKNIFTRDLELDIDNTTGALVLQSTDDRPYVRNNKIYNNVIYGFKQYNSIWHGIKLSVYNRDVQFGPNIFKNNIIYKNGNVNQNGYQVAYFRIVNDMPIDYFDGNLLSSGNIGNSVLYFYEFGQENNTLQQAQEKYAYLFSNNNIDADPLFKNEFESDFRLSEESPCIDAGVALTRCINSGSGIQIYVDDATYFCDGWNITDGDVIKVGSNNPVMILSIDYATNTLTVNHNITWLENDPVNLNYDGKAPDIGAYESIQVLDQNSPAPPVGVTVRQP